MVIVKRLRGPRKLKTRIGFWPVLFFMSLCAIPAWIALSETHQRGLVHRPSPSIIMHK